MPEDIEKRNNNNANRTTKKSIGRNENSPVYFKRQRMKFKTMLIDKHFTLTFIIMFGACEVLQYYVRYLLSHDGFLTACCILYIYLFF